MIYLDVTSACLSPLNTGVKRMQRFLHEQLRSHDDYQPVVWQSVLKAYRAVTVRDLQLLESKVTGSPKGWQLYDSFLPGLWRDLRESLADQKSVMVWPSSLTQGDLILVPDLLWDNRGECFARDFPAGVKRIGIFHDAISITHPGQSRIDATACARGVRALSRFDGVVCLSKDARNDLLNCWKDLGCDPTPVTILPWPVPFSGVRPDSLPVNDSREILYVARLEKRKNHLLLLDACEKLWREGLQFRLRLIGCKSYPLWTRKVLKRIQTLQQQERDLLWLPHVSDAVLHKSYQSAKFTVFPSRAEGFGLPILESLWHGRPVICDWQGAVGELASEGGCLMVDVSNAEKLAGSIRSLLDDQDTYHDLHRACYARKMLGWKDYWDSIKVFSKVL
jgi:glycosyltransferase involved in cell wall biosynthesis